MGKRFIVKEKENNVEVVDHSQHEESLRKKEVLLLQKVRTRLQRSQKNVTKLKENLLLLQGCAINCMDLLETTIDTLEQQTQDTTKVVKLTEQDDSSNVCDKQTVNPRIADLTLKQLRISLQRLAPSWHLQGQEHPVPGGSECVSNNVILSSASDSEIVSSDDEISSNHSEI